MTLICLIEIDGVLQQFLSHFSGSGIQICVILLLVDLKSILFNFSLHSIFLLWI